jgi:hypothetical protein
MLAQTRAAMFLLGPDNKELAISRKKYKDLVDRRKAGSRMYSFDGQNARLIKDSRMTELKDVVSGKIARLCHSQRSTNTPSGLNTPAARRRDPSRQSAGTN